jgi:L-lactate dehydrogenase
MKIGVVGSGLVGATAAYAMLLQGIGREIVLIDKNEARAEAEADDLRHAVPFAHPMHIRAGQPEDLTDCLLVVLAAGVNQEPGESRLHLLERNAAIFRQIVPMALTHAPQAILLVATNPVDVLTHLTARLAVESGSRRGRVLGSGTTLDTARFRSLLGQQVGVDPQHVHAYVVGEHGDTEVLTWSLATVGGMPLDEFCQQHAVRCGTLDRERIDEQVRRAAYRIIEGKGATYYGIGSALARIARAVVQDQRAILTVTAPIDSLLEVENVSVSVPRLIGGSGVIETFPLPLDEAERAALKASAEVVRGAIVRLGGASSESTQTAT